MAESSSNWSETTLNQLHSQDESHLLDVIDRLRSLGIGQFLGEDGLPQLIVCGDQSSGKSSVLEALTRIRFPTRSKLCTTFATELKLRRRSTFRISTQIKPGTARTEEDKQRLAQFKESFSSPEQFSEIIDAARTCMKGDDRESSRTFFDDILQVEITGPDLAPLTIVDLPGITHYSNNQQEVDVVSDLVRKYMKQRNSIILAVVEASNDVNNQVILTYTKDIVPQGDRVLGIITKPDTVRPDSDKEAEFLSLARNTETKFEHGWHVVRNLDSDVGKDTFEQRDRVEKEFFENSSWAGLPSQSTSLGIDSLRHRLSRILLDHIGKNMPSILTKLTQDHEESEGRLKRLGNPRETAEDQQEFLSNISDAFNEHTKDALDAIYRRSDFFDEDHRKLRAVVQNLNEEFATNMLQKGHKWYVHPQNLADNRTQMEIFLSGKGRTYHRSTFLEQIVLPMVRSERGHELPGAFNHLLIGSLFRRQIEPWEGLAMAHIERVWVAINQFLEELLGHITDETTCNNLLVHVFDPAMKLRREAVLEKLQELLLPHKHFEPINLDPSFSLDIPGVVHESSDAGTLDVTNRSSTNNSLTALSSSAAAQENEIHGKLLDAMQSYYKPAMVLFMNNVASLGIEQCLLRGLPKIFSPSVVRSMRSETLATIATESRATIDERVRLRKRLELLENGLETIGKFIPRKPQHQASPSNPPRRDFTSPVDFGTYNQTPRPISAKPSPSPFDFLVSKNKPDPPSNPTTNSKQKSRSELSSPDSMGQEERSMSTTTTGTGLLGGVKALDLRPGSNSG